MIFEGHITVDYEHTPVQRFFDYCHKLDIKPLFFNLINPQCNDHQMLCSIDIEADTLEQAKKLLNKYKANMMYDNFYVIRTKLEAPCSFEPFTLDRYYEVHVKVAGHTYCPRDLFNVLPDWHVSTKHYMQREAAWYLTFRHESFAVVHEKLGQLFEKIKTSPFLVKDGLQVLDYELEKCIYDDNVYLDDSWTRRNYPS